MALYNTLKIFSLISERYVQAARAAVKKITLSVQNYMYMYLAFIQCSERALSEEQIIN